MAGRSAGVMAGRPRLRGVLHQYAFIASLGCGATLILTASAGRARVAAAIYAGAVSALFGTSALYHRITWRPAVRRWMRRLDHMMIFVMIAGTYTPIALIALHGTLSRIVLVAVWAGAAAGALSTVAVAHTPKWASSLIYVTLGCAGLALLGELRATIGWLAVTGLLLGGILYSAGAVIYARQRPNPAPAVFGYHEIFHALVIAAAAVQYGVIAFDVLPYGR